MSVASKTHNVTIDHGGHAQGCPPRLKGHIHTNLPIRWSRLQGEAIFTSQILGHGMNPTQYMFHALLQNSQFDHPPKISAQHATCTKTVNKKVVHYCHKKSEITKNNKKKKTELPSARACLSK